MYILREFPLVPEQLHPKYVLLQLYCFRIGLLSEVNEIGWLLKPGGL